MKLSDAWKNADKETVIVDLKKRVKHFFNSQSRDGDYYHTIIFNDNSTYVGLGTGPDSLIYQFNAKYKEQD